MFGNVPSDPSGLVHGHTGRMLFPDFKFLHEMDGNFMFKFKFDDDPAKITCPKCLKILAQNNSEPSTAS